MGEIDPSMEYEEITPLTCFFGFLMVAWFLFYALGGGRNVIILMVGVVILGVVYRYVKSKVE